MRHRLYLYLHLVWTTLGRRPLIDGERAVRLERLLPSIATEAAATLLGLGVVTTHLHLLLRVHPTFQAGHFVQRAKSISALIIRREGIGDENYPLRWAKGYSVTSVSPGAVPRVLEYVRGQPQHHPSEAIIRVGDSNATQ